MCYIIDREAKFYLILYIKSGTKDIILGGINVINKKSKNIFT